MQAPPLVPSDQEAKKQVLAVLVLVSNGQARGRAEGAQSATVCEHSRASAVSGVQRYSDLQRCLLLLINLPDLINGIYEGGGAVLMWVNVRRILKDKQIRGVDWRIMGFLASWSFYSVFYYPYLGQWWSAGGAAAMILANTIWFLLAVKYRNN